MRLRWHLRRIRWSEPGPRGLVILGVTAVLLLVPYHLADFVDDRSYVVRAMLFFGNFVLWFLALQHVAESDAVEYWLALQGKRPSEWALERWASSLAFAFGVAILWVACATLAAFVYGDAPSVTEVATRFGQLALMTLVASALFFALGATGTKQVAELAILLLFLGSMVPALAAMLPSVIVRMLTPILPPLLVPNEAMAALQLAEWNVALRSLLHVGTWCFVVMGLGIALLNRRVPRV
jgi:hypothetical protein